MSAVDWEKVQHLRRRFENARDEFHLAKKQADEARKLENAARTKACNLETELQAIVVQ